MFLPVITATPTTDPSVIAPRWTAPANGWADYITIRWGIVDATLARTNKTWRVTIDRPVRGVAGPRIID